MKSSAMRTYLYSLSILTVLIVLSCSQDALLTYHDQESLSRPVSSSNSVTKEQLISYLEKETTWTRGLSDNYSIETRVNSEGDTLMYIVNFNGHGWKILSADSRTPAILAGLRPFSQRGTKDRSLKMKVARLYLYGWICSQQIWLM